MFDCIRKSCSWAKGRPLQLNSSNFEWIVFIKKNYFETALWSGIASVFCSGMQALRVLKVLFGHPLDSLATFVSEMAFCYVIFFTDISYILIKWGCGHPCSNPTLIWRAGLHDQWSLESDSADQTCAALLCRVHELYGLALRTDNLAFRDTHILRHGWEVRVFCPRGEGWSENDPMQESSGSL